MLDSWVLFDSLGAKFLGSSPIDRFRQYIMIAQVNACHELAHEVMTHRLSVKRHNGLPLFKK